MAHVGLSPCLLLPFLWFSKFGILGARYTREVPSVISLCLFSVYRLGIELT